MLSSFMPSEPSEPAKSIRTRRVNGCLLETLHARPHSATIGIEHTSTGINVKLPVEETKRSISDVTFSMGQLKENLGNRLERGTLLPEDNRNR